MSKHTHSGAAKWIVLLCLVIAALAGLSAWLQYLEKGSFCGWPSGTTADCGAK